MFLMKGNVYIWPLSAGFRKLFGVLDSAIFFVLTNLPHLKKKVRNPKYVWSDLIYVQ